ncbi:sensor histidine kinase [Sphaerotilus sp.]|uniref:sensor histidine kinase n=1 Tax=Sphaerotilus sp. TaxID=2093942 RepID=UPI0034E261B9
MRPSHAPTDDMPSDPGPTRWRALWLLPMLLALVFVTGVGLWAVHNEVEERAELRRTMITDALSLDAQLLAHLDTETTRLRLLASRLRDQPRDARGLRDQPEVMAGLQRLWISITWLDRDNRIVAQFPDGPPAEPVLAEERRGLSAHLVATIDAPPPQGSIPFGIGESGGERLVVRYAPATLLRRGAPWWLTRRYVVRLVDSSDQVIAALDDQPFAPGERESYRLQAGGSFSSTGTFLELIPREAPRPWWRQTPLVPLGGVLVLIGVATVLLRRQMKQISHAEAAWRTQARWRRAMEDSALVALRARDTEGRLLYVNRTFCDMVGLPANTLIGCKPPMPYWPPDAIEEAMTRSQRNLAGLAPREGYETRWRHVNGRAIDVMVLESPLIDAHGRQIGWMGSIVDITERKRLEERERNQADAMAHQARLTTLGEIASALAHQLNQPLTVIASYNGGVRRSLERAGFDDPAVLTALQRQGEQAAEAGRIVQRIRQFLTRRSPQRERCDVAQTLRRAVGLLGRDLQRQRIVVGWALADGLPAVLADPVLIEQVVINLVRNAADELAQGGGELRISATVTGAHHLRIDIDDNGPGLRGHTIETLCAPFYSTKADGMGMGLAICRSVIEAHHGAMDASASPLGGARFSFTLQRFDDCHDDEPDPDPDDSPGR